MRKLGFCSLILALLLAIPALASPVVVGFDDLVTPNTWLGRANAWGDFGPSYAGLSWTGWEVMNRPAYWALYGDATALPSASNFAYPGLDTPTLTVSSDNLFDFIGAMFAYWPNTGSVVANSVTIKGYRGGNLVNTVSTGQLSTTWAASGGISGLVDRLEFTTAPGSGYFRMDDFVYAPVPEPATTAMAFIGNGLLLVGCVRRRLTKKQ